MGIKILEEELKSPSVFKEGGREKLSLEYIPPILPHRENEYRLLVQHFRIIFDSEGELASRALIRGKIGTGKTALARRFSLDIENFSEDINIQSVHVNCREEGTFFNLLKKVMTKFEPSFPTRGLSSEEILDILLNLLNRRKIHLLLVLDELGYLVRKERSKPLYNLIRFQESRGGPSRLSLICVFREPEFQDVRGLIDKSTLSTIEPYTINLEPYTSDQLNGILRQRVEMAFKENAVTEATIDLISDIAAEEVGNARHAIELLDCAAVIADMRRSPRVLPDHVREAQSRISAILPTLPKGLHERLLLLALARHFERQEEAGYLTMGELREHYILASEEYRKKPLGYTQFWKRMRELSYAGFISTKLSGKGYKGKTTLIGLRIPASPLRYEIERSMGD